MIKIRKLFDGASLQSQYHPHPSQQLPQNEQRPSHSEPKTRSYECEELGLPQTRIILLNYWHYVANCQPGTSTDARPTTARRQNARMQWKIQAIISDQSISKNEECPVDNFKDSELIQNPPSMDSMDSQISVPGSGMIETQFFQKITLFVFLLSHLSEVSLCSVYVCAVQYKYCSVFKLLHAVLLHLMPF